MSTTFPRRAGVAGIALLALTVIALPIALHAASTPGVLEACVNPGNGGMRLVDSNTPCHNNETRVEWNVTGPAGPPGPSSGGPPFVWVCTPAHLPNAGGGPRHDVYVFNGSGTTANVAVNILDSTGNNLTGVAIPGSAGPVTHYPGEATGATAPLPSGHTRDVNWNMPTTGGPGFDGVTNVAFTVRVTSDQPVVVGANFQFNGNLPSQCSLLPR